MPKDRLRGVYGKPVARAAGFSIPLTKAQLEFVGETMVTEIRREIARDTAKSMGIRGRGEPVPIPRTRDFARSFKSRVVGSSTIEIYSDGPTAQQHVSKDVDPDAPKKDRTRPFPMTWLTRPAVPYARIVRQDGQVIVRTTPNPNKGDKPWIHPGFRKYTFLERGIRKGKKKAIEALMEELIGTVLSEHDLLGS